MSVSPGADRDPTLLGGEGQANTACFVHDATEENALVKSRDHPRERLRFVGAGYAEVPDGATAYRVILAVDGLVPGYDKLLGLLGIVGSPVADGRDQRPGAGAAWGRSMVYRPSTPDTAVRFASR